MLTRTLGFAAVLLSLFSSRIAVAADAAPKCTQLPNTPMTSYAPDASHTCVLDWVQQADLHADAALLACPNRDALRTYQRTLRDAWIASFGGFPARTPLNPVLSEPIAREGYTLTKVRFESQPGLFVTAHLFKPAPANVKPRPAILIPCGHSAEGKAADIYQRAALLCAKAGFITLIYDPIDQGERWQLPGEKPATSTKGHNIVGASAMLLGWNTARFRIWDGIRGIDLLTSLPDVDAQRIGVIGNSGGGTLTSYIMSLDERVTTAVPSCYFTTLRDLCAAIGPQDAEQNFFGQLAVGLNHAALLTLRAPQFPVCISATYNDFFPFEGALATLAVAQQVYTANGAHADFKTLRADSALGLIDMPGPHGWKESSLIASIRWLRAKLSNDPTALPIDLAPLRLGATNFNLKAVDCGLDAVAARVTPTGQVRDLPGNRTVYDLMRDELVRCPASALTDPEQKRVCVQRALGLEKSPIAAVTAQLVATTDQGTWTAFHYSLIPAQSGHLTNAIPALLAVPKTVTAPPVFLLSDLGKADTLDQLQHHLDKGSPVLTIDLFATGSIGALKHSFYGSKRADEGISVMLYMLGRSMVEVRTREIVGCVNWLSDRFQKKPVQIIARGSAAIPAYHAYALAPARISAIATQNPPLAWRKVVEQSAAYPFANCVHNALRSYDWVDLYK